VGGMVAEVAAASAAVRGFAAVASWRWFFAAAVLAVWLITCGGFVAEAVVVAEALRRGFGFYGGYGPDAILASLGLPVG